MGLWLKCPGCQANNPLDVRVCPKCGQSLDNLPKESRVYVIGPAAAPAAAQVKAAPAAAPPKPAKAKKPRKKKS